MQSEAQIRMSEFATQPVQVSTAGDADGPAWNRYVERAPAATFFHHFEWRDILRSVFRHRPEFLIARRRETVVGILPLAEVKSRLFGHSLVSLPFCVYGGVVADDEPAAAALEEAAQALSVERGVDHLELRNMAARHADWPTQDLYVTFRKVLDADEEANMLAIPRKQRAMVRKGIKNGLVSEMDGDSRRFFDLYADNVQRHGTPAMPKRYFDTLLDVFGPRCDIMSVLGPDGQPLSSVMSFHFRDEILPYYAGDAEAARDLAGNDFKYWELMRRACARGIRVFDYGRSKQGTGSYAFKKNWGFEPTPLHYEYCLYKRDSVPQNNPSNPKYKLMIAAWRRLPRALANALGPHIVRNLG